MNLTDFKFLFNCTLIVMVSTVICCYSAKLSALTPDQVAVVVNKNDEGSWKVAQYYMRVRQIPDRNLIVLDLPVNTDTITRGFYNVHIAQAIHNDLTQFSNAYDIRCLAIMYGVPLRVGADNPSPDQLAELSNLKAQLVDSEQQIEQGIQQLQSPDFILTPESQPSAGGSPSPVYEPTSAAVETFMTEFQTAVRGAIARINQTPLDQRDELSRNFIDLMTKYIGVGGMTQMLHGNGNSAADDVMQQERLEVQTAVEEYNKLSLRSDLPDNRRQMRHIQESYFGVLGLTKELTSEILFLSQQNGPSAVDSDLMTLLYPGNNQMPWIPNPMLIDTWSNAANSSQRTLMVSRLDAPTPDMVIRMIQSSMNVQAKGLSGTAYFDARGLTTTDAYGNMDQDIRNAAHLIQTNTGMKVVLDNTPALLQAVNCPDAAIYCGWYSVHHYVDSCQWLPGCVAYHIASYELSTLHNPFDSGWCVNLIERGVTGTLGAVDEPYLFAFPRPSEFFPLLLCGRFTQAEVYYLTTPVVGWRIVYVGDPLYNPFKNNPVYPVKLIQQDPILANAFLELPDALHSGQFTSHSDKAEP
ncbi:MAG TPA: TIGR03790 family protein [Phycisphaerae bacterium]|nr:TIGR03790 family protein [Phycisphaerae bacterium]